MIWANFLHIYQPPTQKPFWVKKVADESYRRIMAELKKAKNAKVTLNINAALSELLVKNDRADVIDDLKYLTKRGQVELTGSAKYHPLLPKIPEKEIIRQIKLNEETNKKFFGNLYKPRGFFPPEMGYSANIAGIVKKMGFEWIIVDELSFPKLEKISYSKIYEVKNTGLKIYFRERKMSYKILSGQMGTGQLLIDSLGDRLNKNEYLLTAMDGETFGHHRPGMEHLLFEIYQSKQLKTVLISELPEYFKEIEEIEAMPSTWALMEKDLEKNAPFSRWLDPGNKIHKMQWELTYLSIEVVATAEKKGLECNKSRELLDRALHSDQYWWASAKPWWSLEMMEAGAKELKDVIQMCQGASPQEKQRAQELYQNILFTGFEWQRDGTVENLSRQEDEEIRQRSDEGFPQLPKKEIDKIIANLSKEMSTVAKNQEFERAAQLRDRIKELRKYQKEQ
jgi:predicted glycosyl hydrolase (DUF1957 family)